MHPVAATLREYARGAVGGLFFSLPLLYTMEVWWLGHTVAPLRLIALLVGTAALLFATSWACGLRADHAVAENLFEVAEEFAIGLVIAGAVLLMLGQFPAGGSLSEWLGKLAVEGAVCAVGVSVGRAQLGQSEGDGEGGGDEPKRTGLRALTYEGGLAALGAVVVAANVAPTEEVVMLAAEVGPWGRLGLALASLAVASVLLYFSDFRGSDRVAELEIPLGRLGGAALTYGIGLVVAALLLWVFGRFDGGTPLAALDQTVVLGFPAALGAAAGRLLLSTS